MLCPSCRFNRRETLVSVIMLAVICAVITGCNGPSKTGLEARAAAGDRMNIINAQVQYDQAKQSFEAGQFEKAAREIERAVARYADSPAYYVLQGRIRLETHQLEAALDSLKIAVSKAEKKIEDSEPAEDGKPAEKAKRYGETGTETRALAAVSESQASPVHVVLAQAQYFMGIVYQRWSEDELAYTSYLKAFENESTNAQYLLAAAESLIAMGEFKAASELVEPRMTYFEHNAALRQLLGQIALLTGDPKTAAAFYSQARLLNPDDRSLLEQLMWAQYAAGMFGECMESVKRLEKSAIDKKNTVASDVDLRAVLLHMKARCLKMMGRQNESREAYLELTNLKHSDPTVWTELAALAWDLEDYRRVALCSVQIIALDPNAYEGFMFKAINERENGNLGEAIRLFRLSAERVSSNVDHQSAQPLLLLGATLEQTGDLAAAQHSYEQALIIEPTSSEAQELLRRLKGVSGEQISIGGEQFDDVAAER